MTKLYHYTGIDQFLKALRDNSLRSDIVNVAIKSAEKNKVSYEEAYNKVVGFYFAILKKTHVTSMLLERRSYIHFLRDKEIYADSGNSQQYYRKGLMVVLGFDCQDNMFEDLGDKVRVKGELSLDCLVEVHAQHLILDFVKEKLLEYDKKVPLYLWSR